MHIAMDMGTSNTRLWLCEQEKVRHFVKIPVGAGVTKAKGKDVLFAEIKKLIHTLLEEAKVDASEIGCIVASGMAGSELGLAEVPRIPLPADAYALAENLQARSLPEIT